MFLSTPCTSLLSSLLKVGNSWSPGPYKQEQSHSQGLGSRSGIIAHFWTWWCWRTHRSRWWELQKHTGFNCSTRVCKYPRYSVLNRRQFGKSASIFKTGQKHSQKNFLQKLTNWKMFQLDSSRPFWRKTWKFRERQSSQSLLLKKERWA